MKTYGFEIELRRDDLEYDLIKNWDLNWWLKKLHISAEGTSVLIVYCFIYLQMSYEWQ